MIQKKVGLSGRRAATRSSSTPRLGPTTSETRSRRPLVRREPRVTPGSSATQDHQTRVPRPVSGWAAGAHRVSWTSTPSPSARSRAPRPRAGGLLPSSSTPPRSAAAAEAIAAGARTARARAARRDGRRSPNEPRRREPPLEALVRSRGLGRSGLCACTAAPGGRAGPWHAAS